MSVGSQESLQIGRLRTAFLNSQLSASELIEWILTRIAKWDDPALWITRTSDPAEAARNRTGHCGSCRSRVVERLPLFGIPFG